MESNEKRRCWWAGSDPLYQAYHDHEWGVPVHDDMKLFEMLSLEGAQAGLSWITILRRREGYRTAFAHFDPRLVATYDEERILSLVHDAGIVRHEGKIRSVVSNAKAVLTVQEEFASLDAYLWQFVGGKTQINCVREITDIQSKTTESDAMSKALKKRGFSFVGSTICYAFM